MQALVDAIVEPAATVIVRNGRVTAVELGEAGAKGVVAGAVGDAHAGLVGGALAEPPDVFATLNDAFVVDPVVVDVPAGVVISFADGTLEKVPKGEEVGLIVSAGPAPRTVPQGLEGHSVDEVVAQLNAMQLKPARIDVYNDTGRMRVIVAHAELPPGNLAMYYPEANALVPRRVDAASGTPAFKSVLCRIEPRPGTPRAARG